MATAADVGQGRLRDMQDVCDLCGDVYDGSAEIGASLACNRCGCNTFHQACLERFLKKHSLESNRKTGFPCPMGKGKGTQAKAECKGKIDKSHPIIPRNDEKKAKKQAPPLAVVMARQQLTKPKPPKPAGPPAPRKAAPSSLIKRTLPRPPMPAVNAWQQPEAVRAALNAPPALLEAMHEKGEEEAVASEPRPAGLPVGMVLEQAMTKAQRKNLNRRKKKEAAAAPGGDAASEAGTAITDASGDAICLEDWDAAAERLASGRAAVDAGFITDAARYRKLLGLQADSDADSDDADDEAGSGSGLSGDGEGLSLGDECSLRLTASDSSDGGAASPAGGGCVLLPVAPVIAAPAAGAAGAQAAVDEDAAVQAAVAASLREYACEQERQRQRAVLAGGGLAAVQLPVAAPVVGPSKASPPPLTWQLSGDGGAGAAPAFSFPPAPLAAPAAAPVGASYGAGAHAFGGAPAVPAVPAYMAAGHELPAVPEEEDDDLESLLALCGVAG